MIARLKPTDQTKTKKKKNENKNISRHKCWKAYNYTIYCTATTITMAGVQMPIVYVHVIDTNKVDRQKNKEEKEK